MKNELIKMLIEDELKGLKTGYKTHRLQPNDPYYRKEINFVKQINEDMKHDPNCLSNIVGKPLPKDYLTGEEEKAVLSVIQWLGTPVGQNFLERVSKLPL